MTEKELEKLQNLEEVGTEYQGLVKKGWKILKVLRTTSGSYTKYAIIECIHCKDTKLVLYYPFLNTENPRPCIKCGGNWIVWAHEMEGKIVGHYKILKYVDLIKRDSNKKVDIFFKVQCIHCGDIKERELFSKSNWNRYPLCPSCPRRKDNYYDVRYKEYKNGAKSRKINWNLSLDDFIKIGSGNCAYCGTPASLQSRYQHGCKYPLTGLFNGVDRIDSNKGYSVDNCVSCCSDCNVMKLDHPLNYFLKHIRKIYDYQTKQGLTTIENTSIDGSELSTL